MGKAAVITWNLRASPRRDDVADEDDSELDAEEHKSPGPTVGEVTGRVTTCVSGLSRHLNSIGVDRAVVVFQEVPSGFKAVLASATNGAWSVVETASHHVAIATMGSLDVTRVEALAAAASPAEDRALLVDVVGLLASRVRIVGLHWLDRWNTPPGSERNFLGMPFWSNIRQQWDYPESPHFIVLGDFNESPHDDALVSRHCLWAIRDRADLKGRTHPKDKRPPLYNPMWGLLPERVSPRHGPHGTFHWYRPGVSGVRWWHIDQILLSPSTVDLLESVNILVELDGQRLVNKNGKPDKRIASDHLPVIAILGA